MKQVLIPKIYVQDVFSIPYKSLKKKGISYLLFDVDNTILEIDKEKVTAEMEKLFIKLQKMGFSLLLFSNAASWRLKKVKKQLQIPVFSFSCKPLKRSYKKVLQLYTIEPSSCAAIGDQLYTDVKGANQMGFFSILVDPLSTKDSFFSFYNRMIEKSLFKKETILFRRGAYYE